LTVRTPDGAVVAQRKARNMVLRSGATRVAELLAGIEDTPPIDTIGVGFAVDPGGPDLGALTLPPAESEIEPTALRTALTGDGFEIDTETALMVRLNITATFRPTIELPDVSEAGLLSGDTLYNQVIFEPVTMALGQDITFFWQIDFPYGR